MKRLLLIAVLFMTPLTAQACDTTVYTVAGTSMDPLIPNGSRIDAIPPNCLGRGITHGDIVVFLPGTYPMPIIKRVMGVPGDRLSIAGGQLSINGARAATSTGKPYQLPPEKLKMFALYAQDYGGKIPPHALLVLGDDPYGSSDSSVFGLISLDNIAGVMTGPH
jgi:signal peptidase I